MTAKPFTDEERRKLGEFPPGFHLVDVERACATLEQASDALTAALGRECGECCNNLGSGDALCFTCAQDLTAERDEAANSMLLACHSWLKGPGGMNVTADKMLIAMKGGDSG